MLILYWVIGIISILVLISILIKIYVPFWCRQPVFHVYDVPYYFFSPKVLSETIPQIDDKYVNMKNIIPIYGNEQNTSSQSKMTNLLREHYLRSKNLNYLPEDNNIVPYLELNDVIILYYLYGDTIIGTITLRPIECILDGSTLPLQYVDYLCVHKEHRKKGIAQQLIRTLYYYQRQKTYYNISLFKNEGKQRAIIPFTIYDSYRLVLKKVKEEKLKPEYKFNKVTEKNIHTLYEVFKSIKLDFTYYVSMNITNMLLLIRTGNIELYYLSYKDIILSLYYVRNSKCYNMENKVVKEIYTSYKSKQCTNSNFQIGFMLLLYTLQNETLECIVENVGHNRWLIDWLKQTHYINKMDRYIVGYYLYNYLHKTVKSEELFINI